MKDIVVNVLEKVLSGKLKKGEIEKFLEVPPQQEMGDFAFPCFALAKIEKKNPLAIATDLSEKIRKNLPKEISGVEVKSAYVNFFIDKKFLAEKVLKEATKKGYGSSKEGNGKKIVIDLSSPNIAKPFGIGHLRSTIIGGSISNIASYLGYKTVKINYLGDWGTQFGKLIVGYNNWGDEKKLKDNPIAHLLELYVRANDEQYEQAARDEFRKLEEGDKKNLALWKKFRDLSLKDFNEIYEFLGVKFDVISGESLYNDKMGPVVNKLEKKGLLKESEGAMVVDLDKEGLGVVLIKKNDGTSLYATRDLTAAIDRFEKYKFNRMIYEVGQEQKLHFKQVFRVLKLLGYDFSDDCVHVAHGLYLGEDGKKFATRKGKTVMMKEVIKETYEIAKKNLLSREAKLSDLDLDHRAHSIALSAIIYGDLKNYRENDVVFDIDKFLEFEGNTGPYLLYAYARASSILRKVKSKKQKVEIFDLSPQETALLTKLQNFPNVVKSAYDQLAPNLIANYSYELAQIFNEFYHAHPVIGSKEEAFRLKLIDAFRNVLKTGLGLLGIDVLEEM
ncbi:Arginine--tRNA ligase [uncultured archaeon]|nr:Arginine--tRNA ligase [uncultured archaeon]